MKVAFKKEIDLRVDMGLLMDECIERLEWQKRRKELGHYTPDYDLETLVEESLEFLYNIEIYEYDNGLELREVISKNLLIWCLEHDYIKEHNQLEELL